MAKYQKTGTFKIMQVLLQTEKMKKSNVYLKGGEG
jgi:hypothetical protein